MNDKIIKRLYFFSIIFILVGFGYVNAKLSQEDIGAITATGLIPLTDEQNGEYAARDYLIIEKMYIMRFDTVKFAPGSRIFFHPYSRIHVHGALFFNGTKEKPITIGKLPFSIPGLTTPIQKILDDVSVSVYKDAHLTMRYTTLLDSSININFTEETSSFVIDSIKCSGNKLSIADTMFIVGKDVVLSASRENQKLILPPPSVLSPQKFNLEDRTKSTNKQLPILPFRILFGVGAIAGAGIGIYYDRRAEYFYWRYFEETKPQLVKMCREENKKYVYFRNGAMAGAILFSTLFSASFFFDIRYKH